MKIGVLTNYHLEELGGAEEALDRLAHHWQANGHQVVLFAAKGRGRKMSRPWTPTYQVTPIPAPISTRFGLSLYVRWLEAEHRRGAFDVIVGSDAYWPGYVVQLFSRRRRVPMVVYSHGGDCMRGSRFLRKRICRDRMAAAVVAADGVACISAYVRERLEMLARPNGIVELVPNGWPDEWDQVAVPPRPAANPYLFALGRVVELKGFQVLVDAYHRLRNKHAHLGLVIAGDGPYLPQLVKQAQALGLNPTRALPKSSDEPVGTCFPGAVLGQLKLSLLAHANVGICPSIRDEPQGLVVLEMLCRGVPVVGSMTGGIPDIVRSGVNGDLFTVGDAADLANKLDRILQDQPQRDRMAANCRPSVDSLRWSAVAQRHIDLFIAARARSICAA